MFTHQLQRSSPPVRYASGFPIADDVRLNIEMFGEGADGASGFDGVVKNFHDGHLITKVTFENTKVLSPSTTMKTLASRLLSARESKQWKQKHLAVAAGVSVSTIGMLESGKRGNTGTTPGTLPQIAKALGVNFDWLAYGDGEMGANITAPAPTLSASGGPDYAKQIAILFNGLPVEARLEAFNAVLPVLLAFLPPQTESKTPALPQSDVANKQSV